MTFGVVLGAIGAIMRFAVTVTTTGFNINVAGDILMVVGVGALLIGLILVIVGSSSRSTTEERVERTPGGEVRVADHYNRAP
jgi:hypothetical protein